MEIDCGLGLIKSGEYYYTDCCGNFITGTVNPDETLQVSFNYNLASGNVGRLDVTSSIACATPTPTPTPTITPTNTITPTQTPTNTLTPTPSITPSVTPSNTPVTRLKNDCDVITLFDLGINCNVIQSPTESNPSGGVLSLNVTGGTAPYSFFWEGGQRSQTLFGVPAGSYEVVVTDYSWPNGSPDYTATTICELIGPIPTQTPTTTPTPTPTSPVQCVDLCLIAIGAKGIPNIGPIQFICDGTQNGRFKWTSGRQDIIWNINNSRWEIYYANTTTPFIIGNSGGILASTSYELIPDSAWVVLGGTEEYSVTMTKGECPTSIPLQVSIDKTNSSCQGTTNCNGSISIFAQDGISPYSYSINNGITFSVNNTFTNLCPNTYTVVVSDSNNDSQTSTITIDYDSTPVTYQLSLANVIPATTTSTLIPLSQTVTQQMVLVVNPTLPVGVSISFNLLSTALMTVNSPGSGMAQVIWDVSKNYNLISTTVGPTTPVSQGTRPYCSPNTQTVTSIDYSTPITITNGDVITIASTTVDTILYGTVSSQSNCTTNVITQISAVISTPTIIGNTCSSVIGSSRVVQTNDFTYVPVAINPWTASDIVCNYKSIDITSIKGSTEAADTIVYVTADGNRMYVPSYGNQTIKQYSLSISNDITSTLTYVGVSPILPFKYTGMQMSSDGTKVFVFANLEGVIREYELSTPWDITSMSTTLVNSLNYPTNEYSRTFAFNRDGTKIYATYVLASIVPPYYITIHSVVWNLSTPYDLSSAGIPITSNITSSIPVTTGTMYFEKGNNHYFAPVGNSGNPYIAVFNNGITNNDLDSTGNNCLFGIPSCTDDVNIYNSIRSGANDQFTWTLRQSLTGL